MKKFYAGIAVDHLNEPEESFIRPAPGSRLPRKYTFNGGLHFPIGDSAQLFSINPDVIYLHQRDFNLTIATVTARIKYLLLGSGIKIDSGYLFSVGVEASFIRFCYTYDLDHARHSGYSNIDGVSHEFSLAFYITRLHPNKGRWSRISVEAI